MANINENRKLMDKQLNTLRKLNEGNAKSVGGKIETASNAWDKELRQMLLPLTRFEMGDRYAKKYLGIKNGDKVRMVSKGSNYDVSGTIEKLQASVNSSGGHRGGNPSYDLRGWYVQFKSDVVDNNKEAGLKPSTPFNHSGVGTNRLVIRFDTDLTIEHL